MNRCEALVLAGDEADRFDAALFRYLEDHGPDGGDERVILRSCPEGAFERKTVILWSRPAAEDFVGLWLRLASKMSRLNRA